MHNVQNKVVDKLTDVVQTSLPKPNRMDHETMKRPMRIYEKCKREQGQHTE